VALSESSPDEDLRELAARLAKAYQYPVDSMVVTSAGELRGHVEANELMGDDTPYLRLLDSAR